ncbi:uncharacterized protein LOC125252300 [Megalobrama amblycephala]|uniref:uncharacterized protein LOC125252300 n=1 Tax=Megalobrama amblycephala TaxID=75352 RepID=UPI002013C754|nr:uncharacterized protein LOC125252300 [Megalobrama amblycephala]
MLLREWVGFIYSGKPISGVGGLAVSGFTRLSRDAPSLVSFTIYSSSCVWMAATFNVLSQSQVDDLLACIGARISYQDSNYRCSIPAAERLSICLRFLATGDSFRTIASSFRVGVSTVCSIIPTVVTGRQTRRSKGTPQLRIPVLGRVAANNSSREALWVKDTFIAHFSAEGAVMAAPQLTSNVTLLLPRAQFRIELFGELRNEGHFNGNNDHQCLLLFCRRTWMNVKSSGINTGFSPLDMQCVLEGLEAQNVVISVAASQAVASDRGTRGSEQECICQCLSPYRTDSERGCIC